MTILNFLKRAVIVASAVFVLSSCGDTEGNMEEKNEMLFNQIVNADETTGKSEVAFVTTGAWTSTITEVNTKLTKSGTASWISISPDHGDAAGEYTITISFQENYTSEDRKATITISFDNMDITISVTQRGTDTSGTDTSTSGTEASTSGITYPEIGKGGINILADDVVEVKPTRENLAQYSVKAVLPTGSSLKIVITGEMGDFGFYSGTNENWSVSNTAHGQFTLISTESGRSADAEFSSSKGVKIEYYENGATTPTKIKRVEISDDVADDDKHEREMLITFYQSTNGDKWIRKDNWCSDKPISQWYGVTTHGWSLNESLRNRVAEINLPDNNLTGEAYLADFKSIRGLNILDGNKIESLTIVNNGNEQPIYSNLGFYHDSSFGNVHLKTLKISNSGGHIYVSGNFSANSVIISGCNLSNDESMFFNLPSTKIGTLTVSDCTMGYFYADNCIIENITIDNCTFLPTINSYNGYIPDGAYIRVGNRTQVNNCSGLRYIYSSRDCSDLIVTNTICNDIQCNR